MTDGNVMSKRNKICYICYNILTFDWKALSLSNSWDQTTSSSTFKQWMMRTNIRILVFCEIFLSDSDNVHTEKDEVFPFVQFRPRPLKVFQHRHSGRKRYKRKAVKSKPCAETIIKSESFYQNSLSTLYQIECGIWISSF